jgi:chromosome partitioning protein
VLIDTPGRNTPAITRIVPHLDLALVPARPSPMDLEASIPTLDAIEQLGRRAVFVVNGASTSNTAITGDIRRELSALGVVAPTTVHNRDDFVRPMIRGLVAAEARPKGNAALEIRELWK